jgi:hypothetical protein
VQPAILLPLPPLQAGCFWVQVPLYRHRKHTLEQRSLVRNRRQIIRSINRSIVLMVNGLQLYHAFLTSGRSKRFTILPNIHPFTHTFTHRRRSLPRRATASSSGAVRVRRLAQGHLDTQLGGAGDRTSNLPVTGQPAVPPEPHVANISTPLFNPSQILVLSKVCLPPTQTAAPNQTTMPHFRKQFNKKIKLKTNLR